MMLSRRAWLGGAAAMAGALLLPRGRSALAATAMATSAPKIDVHVHLAGTGAGDSGCWISPAFRRRYTFRAMRFLYGITAEQMERSADEAWAEMVAERVAASEAAAEDIGKLAAVSVVDPVGPADDRGGDLRDVYAHCDRPAEVEQEDLGTVLGGQQCLREVAVLHRHRLDGEVRKTAPSRL